MRAVAERVSFDVLVVGSGASGLAAALSAERAGARVALVTKGALQSCNSAKAQGGIQAAFGDDDSPEQHAEDVWQSSHETADRRLVEVLTAEAPTAIHWLEEQGVEFTRENGGYRLARCGGATRKRLLQVGDRTGHAITTAVRDAYTSPPAARASPTARSSRSSRTRTAGSRPARSKNGDELVIDAGAVVLAAGGRCYREAEERGELSTNHPGATGEVTRLALELGAESRDLDALLRLAVAAPARGQDDCAGVDHELVAVLALAGRDPAVLGLLERDERAVGEALAAGRRVGVAHGRRDRVAGAVADLRRAFGSRRRSGQAVAAVLARELDALLLERMDRRRRLGGEHLGEPAVGRLVRTLPDVLGMLLGQSVLAEGRLDPALRLGRVARLERALGHE